MSIFDYPDLIPESVHEIANVIGNEATEKLVKAVGGARFKMGKGMIETERLGILYEALGDEKTHELLEVYGGEELYIPCCNAALRAARNDAVYDDFFELKEQGENGLMAVTKLAAKYRISERTIYTIVGYGSNKKHKPSSREAVDERLKLKFLKKWVTKKEPAATFSGNWKEVTDFVDENTTPENAGKYLIEQDERGVFHVYIFPLINTIKQIA